MSYLYNDSEVKCLPYLTTKRCTFKCDRTSPCTECAVQLHSCVFMTQRKRRKASHLSMSLPNGVNLACTVPMRDARSRCPESACLNLSPVPRASARYQYVMLLQCLQILARHRWKKRKIASCIPRRRLEAIHFPHKARGKRKKQF